jgi:hypothetical protein
MLKHKIGHAQKINQAIIKWKINARKYYLNKHLMKSNRAQIIPRKTIKWKVDARKNISDTFSNQIKCAQIMITKISSEK